MFRHGLNAPKSLIAKQIKEALVSTLNARVAAKSAAAVPRLIPKARETGFVESFDGTRIYWEQHGPTTAEAPELRPMVFCYGLVCSMNMWRIQLDRYKSKHPCILLDYRGHHKSSVPEEASRMNISAIARDVAAVIKFHKPKLSPHIWGHSMGVNVALELAAAQPELCHTLTLLCGTARSPFNGMFGNDIMERVLDPVLKAYPDNKELFHLIWQVVLTQTKFARTAAGITGFNDKASRTEDLDAYAAAVTAIDPSTFFPLITEMSRGMTAGVVPKVKTPSLVVAGSHDLVTPPAAQKELVEMLPDATYVEIPAGSHNVELDFGEYVCMKVEEYWKTRGLR